jgi:uncharacterized membrane protein YkvA (DUF1232 family)
MENSCTKETVESYIETAASLATSRDIRHLRSRLPALAEKSRKARAEGRQELCRQIAIIADILSSPKTLTLTGRPPKHLAELSAAAGYLLKDSDLIPDDIDNIGLSDDEMVVSAVFRRNQKLASHRNPPPLG